MTDSEKQGISSTGPPPPMESQKAAGAPILLASSSRDPPKGIQDRGLQATMKQDVAPKRFKSSFIFFSMEKHKEIKEQLAKDGKATKTTNITKIVSDAWRNLSPENRAKYNAMASEDKERYDIEKAAYSAPPGASKKKTRTPGMPRRPSSAFLAFANCRRAQVKAENMDKSNGAISKLLSIMWKEADEEIKLKYRNDEAALWKKYKIAMEEWRKKEGSVKQDKGERRKFGAKVQEKTGHELPSAQKKRKVDPASFPNDITSNLNHSSVLPTVSAINGVETGTTLPLSSINRNSNAASAYASLLNGGVDPYAFNLGLSGNLLGQPLGYSADLLGQTSNLAMLSALARPPLGAYPFERSHPLLSTLYGSQEPLLAGTAHQLSLSRMAALIAAEQRLASQGSGEGNAKTPKGDP